MTQISIIIPIYNVENYIANCLDSIIAQSYTDFEAICIDDGSTDNSLNILRQYEKIDSRIKVVSKKNQGVSAARNKGLELANGQYISFIDSDDEIDSHFLEAMSFVLENNNDVDLAWVDVQKGEARQKYPYKFSFQTYENIFTHYLSRKKPKILSSTVNKLYRKSLLEDIRFPEGMTVGEDLVFLYQVLYKTKKAIHIPQRLYFYRYREESAVHKKLTKQRIEDEFLSAKMLWDLFKDKQMPRSTKKKLNQYVAKRFLYNVIKLPKQKDKENFSYWVKTYMPFLQKLEKEGIFQTKHLSIKNKLLYWWHQR